MDSYLGVDLILGFGEGLGEEADQVGGYEGLLACICGGEVSGKAVEIDGKGSGFEKVFGMLGQESGYDAGEDVAGASGGHAGIAGGIDPDNAVGSGDKGAMAFEDDDEVVIGGELARDFQAVGLNFGNGDAGQARHFSGMRSDDQRAAVAAEFATFLFESIETIGVDDHGGGGCSALEELADEFGGFGMTGDSRADGYGFAFEEFFERV